MVYIKKLEIYGFKSFGFKNAVLNLDRGLIAITGPNGSGKSNIFDAIMFAIGENSPKSLRVDKFQSLFHDSQSSSNRVVRVSLTFDNQDRGIPVDKDSVILTREIEGQTGESQYFLNGKKVAKNIITELLEIVVATPNKLNIVQQGMITRISELNSEERRKIIEDIIGLSYFDEKKTEALKQLDASDRRLEIALARIGEIRKRIDELEVERNEQLRFSQVEQEIKRFNAAKLSDYITKTRTSLRTQQELLQSKTKDSLSLSDRINQLHSEIEKLEADKMKFIQEVDIANKTKSQIGTRISQIIYDYERKKAIAKESEQRCTQIKEKFLPTLDIEIDSISKKLTALNSDLDKKKNPILELSEKQSVLKHKLDLANVEIDVLGKSSVQATKAITKLEQRYKQLEKVKNDIHVLAIGLEEKLRSRSQQAINNDNGISNINSENIENRNHLSSIELQLNNKNRELDITKTLIIHLETEKNKIAGEIKDLRILFGRAHGMISEYDSQASTAKNMMNEDLAIVEMTKLEQGPTIRGLVCDLISWEERYEKSVLAAGADMMKAFVVDDLGSMLSVLEFAKTRKLPRLKIISLDLLKQAKKTSNLSISRVDENDTNIIGTLDKFVYSEHVRLPVFLFGHTYLVKTVRSAYLLAKQGYRAVSVEGELFEPLGSTISADFGSKIAYFGEAILLADSVEDLRNSVMLIKRFIEDKEPILRNVAVCYTASERHKSRLEAEITKLEVQKAVLSDNLDSKESKLQELVAENDALKSGINSGNLEMKIHHRRLSILSCTISDVTKKLNSLNIESTGKKLTQANWSRNTILKSLDDIEYQLREQKESLRSLEAEIEISANRIKNLKREKDEDLEFEMNEKSKEALELKKELALQEDELKGLIRTPGRGRNKSAVGLRRPEGPPRTHCPRNRPRPISPRRAVRPLEAPRRRRPLPRPALIRPERARRPTCQWMAVSLSMSTFPVRTARLGKDVNDSASHRQPARPALSRAIGSADACARCRCCLRCRPVSGIAACPARRDDPLRCEGESVEGDHLRARPGRVRLRRREHSGDRELPVPGDCARPAVVRSHGEEVLRDRRRPCSGDQPVLVRQSGGIGEAGTARARSTHFCASADRRCGCRVAAVA